ncbi:MAG: hypothetical protein V4684_08560 [Pseudomonadota bacterium]
MPSYYTLHEAFDLTPVEIAGAKRLTLAPITPAAMIENAGDYDNYASVSTYTTTAKIFVFSANQGASYQVSAVSSFDPRLRLYDWKGNLIEEASDFSPFDENGVDVIRPWVAPYTGDYYIEPDWWMNLSKTASSALVVEDVGAITRDGVFGSASAESLQGAHGTNLAGLTVSTNEIFYGYAGNDTITGFGGDDVIFGGDASDTDTAVYHGLRSEYSIALNGIGGVSVKDKVFDRDGADEVYAERLLFADGGLAFDLDTNAGMVAKVLGAVFGKSYATDPLYVGLGLDAIDATPMSIEQLSAGAMSLAMPGASNSAIVGRVYTNMAGHAPSAPVLASYTSLLDSGQYSVGEFVAAAANLEINAINIGLVGLHTTGLAFI